MPGPFHGIEMASRALRAFQRAIDVTGNNISNVNTKGYSRQTIDFVNTDPTSFFGTQLLSLGTGVNVSSVNRLRDLFLDERMREGFTDMGRLDARRAVLEQVESSFGEPGASGIAVALDKFFQSWSALGSSPDDAGMKNQVRLAGQTLADRIANSYGELGRLQEQIDSQIVSTIGEVNELATKIASLNAEIRKQKGIGVEPADLLDQRDVAIEQLAQLVDIRATEFDDGAVVVSVNQFMLVSTDGARELPTAYDSGTQRIQVGTYQVDVHGGKLAGLMSGWNAAEDRQEELNILADTLRTEINLLHRTGTNSLGATNVDFFEDLGVPAGAAGLRLSKAILSGPENVATGVTGDSGDGHLALGIAALRELGLGALGGATVQNWYRGNLTRMGQEVNQAQLSGQTQSAILDQIEAQRQSVTGVNLDEEMASLMKFQRSYQAAARTLQLFDQVTEELIGIIR